MQIICVPIIVSVVVCIMQAYKKIVAKTNETLTRIIPILALVLGGILGVVCYFAFPTIIMAENWYMAIVVGAASGLSATGCNQIFKQLKKFGIDVKEVDLSDATADKIDSNKNDESDLIQPDNSENNTKPHQKD